MPTLEWIGKKAVVNHHRDVPFHLLEEVPELSFGDKDTGNLLVQGDNLTALKALLPYYAGKVKCIYIDPPYNTGNENWVYNDNVNDPQIKEWLGNVVGKEAEDLSRHDKWLCMMYPRLKLLHQLLKDDGVIFISLDDIEVSSLRLMMDEIFGVKNFVANVVWQKRTSPDSRATLGAGHDHIIVYAKEFEKIRGYLNQLPLSEKQKNLYSNLDNDPRGPWTSTDFTAQGWRPNQMYEITTPSGIKYLPPSGRCWKNVETVLEGFIADGRIWFGAKGNARPRIKSFFSEIEGYTAWTWWTNVEVGHNQEAKKEMNVLFGATDAFDTPKPERLIQRIIQLATKAGDIVLDSFLGSGTTCAVAHKMNRRYIGIELGEHCETHCAVRMKKVIEGEQGGISKEQNWKGGGGFRYYRLGKPLFDESGKVYKRITFSKLARHVFFTETGHPLEKEHCDSSMIGTYNNTAVYLLFNGILKDKKPDSGNVLTGKILALLPEHDGPKVIYGTACRLSPVKLRNANIVFKQVPYEIKAD
ncbi:MAG: site-specific DNA-methyltransferase [Victivallaceae bacterium]|jgi:DNA modification methylase